MNIIGISGRIGSGKDTVANIIQYITHKGIENPEFDIWVKYSKMFGSISKWEIRKFAQKVKDTASMLTGIPVEKFEDQEFKKTKLGEEWNYYSIDYDFNGKPISESKKQYTVREFLQNLGTEGLRSGLHEDVWVNALWSDYKSNRWIITDTRFKNEAKSIKDRGGIVLRLTRNEDQLSDHISETELDNYDFNYIIDNKDESIEDTFESVKEFIKEYDL